MNDSLHNHPRKLMLLSIGAVTVAVGYAADNLTVLVVGLLVAAAAVGQFVSYWGAGNDPI